MLMQRSKGMGNCLAFNQEKNLSMKSPINRLQL